jgi:hypothetical protein
MTRSATAAGATKGTIMIEAHNHRTGPRAKGARRARAITRAIAQDRACDWAVGATLAIFLLVVLARIGA